MAKSKPNKYLKYLSNRTSAAIFNISLLLVYLYTIYINCVLNKKYYLAIPLSLFLPLRWKKFCNVIKKPCKTSESIQTKQDYIKITELICLVVLISKIVGYFLFNDKKKIIRYKYNYEINHPGITISENEVIWKIRYEYFTSLIIIVLVVCVYNFLEYITDNEYIKEIKVYEKIPDEEEIPKYGHINMNKRRLFI